MLFDPLTLRGLTFRNRIGVSPMCQYSAQDGFANDWHLVHLGSRAAGGAGLVIMEATGVEPRGRISPNDLGIWKDEHIVKLEQITRFIASQGAVAGIQLAHAGRKASTPQPWAGDKPLTAAEGGWIPVAPSAIAFDQQYQVPMALKTEEIINIIELFKSAARRALQSGFKVVEVHSAHGYLLHEFLSPISNQRLDSYGGSFDNRVRLLEEVVAAIRSVWPEEYPLFVRISATDWIEPEGWTLEQAWGPQED
jgi:2,4-dienoyl-CoA reductase-like NADH-dependent reductase (Old Yellow Enzyme family)